MSRATTAVRRNRLAGLTLAATGLFAIYESSNYALGTLRQMGPGFMPLVLGALLIVLAVAVGLEPADDGGQVPQPGLRPLLAIFGSVLAFGLLIERLGLVPATFVLVLVAGLAETRFRPLALLALAAALSLFTYLTFVKALGVPILPVVGLG